MSKNTKPENETTELNKILFNSPGVNSLNLESQVYESFKKQGWRTQHSPYYIDQETKKYREIDVTARKYWTTDHQTNLSCDVNFLIECKTLKDFHIVVSNTREHSWAIDLYKCWIGETKYDNYSKVIELLKRNEVNEERIRSILRDLNLFCFPNYTYRFRDSEIDPFNIPVFNSYRETNIGSTKELDNSVVWKSFQSLHSCIQAYESMVWDGIESPLFDIENDHLLGEEARSEKLKSMLILKASHIRYIQPIIVVESNLWELKKGGLKKLKYLRLLFQRLFQDGTWIDIVNKQYLQEYINKSKKYDLFLSSKNFRLHP
jgi:hypothetical protein